MRNSFTKTFLLFSLIAFLIGAPTLTKAAGFQFRGDGASAPSGPCFATQDECITRSCPLPPYTNPACGGSFGCIATLCDVPASPGSGSPSGPGSGRPEGGSLSLPNPLGSASTFPELLENIMGFLRIIAIPIVAIMILVGAYQILFAAGDPEKFGTGKKTILYAVIGYAIILISSGVVSIIRDVLEGS